MSEKLDIKLKNSLERIDNRTQIEFTVEVCDRLNDDSAEPVMTLDHEDYSDKLVKLVQDETVEILKRNAKDIHGFLTQDNGSM